MLAVCNENCWKKNVDFYGLVYLIIAARWFSFRWHDCLLFFHHGNGTRPFFRGDFSFVCFGIRHIRRLIDCNLVTIIFQCIDSNLCSDYFSLHQLQQFTGQILFKTFRISQTEARSHHFLYHSSQNARTLNMNQNYSIFDTNQFRRIPIPNRNISLYLSNRFLMFSSIEIHAQTIFTISELRCSYFDART